MTRYHIFKGTRLYSGYGYCGPSSNGILMETDDYNQVVKWLSMLREKNSGVDWQVYDTLKQMEVH